MGEGAEIVVAGPPPRFEPGDDRLGIGVRDRNLQLPIVDPGLDDRRGFCALAGRIMLIAQGETGEEYACGLAAAHGNVEGRPGGGADRRPARDRARRNGWGGDAEQSGREAESVFHATQDSVAWLRRRLAQ